MTSLFESKETRAVTIQDPPKENPVREENASKRKLLETAMELIWESSYGSVSVDDICAKSRVNKGSFYHFYRSKSDLTAAAMERHWEHQRSTMDAIFSPSAPALERIDKYCQVVIEDQRRQYETFGKVLGCPFCSVGSELSTRNEQIRLKAEQMNQRTIKYFESAIRDLWIEGLIEVKDITELARAVQSFVTGVLTQAKIENSFRQVEGLDHGVKRLLGLKQEVASIA